MYRIDSLNHAELRNENPSMPKLDNVQMLQIHDSALLGAVHNSRGKDRDKFYSAEAVDGYFIIDLRGGTVSNFKNSKELEETARQRGIALKLESVESVYWRYRPTGTESVAKVVGLAGPGMGFCGLCVWIWRVRKRGTIPRDPVSTES